MRRLLVVLALLLGLLIAADFGLKALAQYWVGRELQRSLALDERPSVSLGGFPFLPELVSGNVDSVTVRSNGMSNAASIPLEGVTLTLRDVSFSTRQLVAGNGSTIRAARGEGTASLTESDVNRAVQGSASVTVRFEDGKVVVRAGQTGQEFAARLEVTGGRLIIRPTDRNVPSFAIDLPEVVPGTTYRDVKIEGSTAVLTFTLRNTTFDIPKS